MIKSPLHVSSPHDSAADHVTGAAIYVDDMPSPKGMLWGMVVPSPVAKGKIKGWTSTRPGLYLVFRAFLLLLMYQG